jgi:hypothetical protein
LTSTTSARAKDDDDDDDDDVDECPSKQKSSVNESAS